MSKTANNTMSSDKSTTREEILAYIRENEPVRKKSVVIQFDTKPIFELRKLLKNGEITYSDSNELVIATESTNTNRQ